MEFGNYCPTFTIPRCARKALPHHRLAFCLAAWSRRNRGAVGAGSGMAEERADFVGGFRRKDVLELAGLLFDFGFAVHGQAVSEEALGQAVAADDAAGAVASAARSR